jgi:hypothetical protein
MRIDRHAADGVDGVVVFDQGCFCHAFKTVRDQTSYSDSCRPVYRRRA